MQIHRHVTIVDDEEAIVEFTKFIARREGFTCEEHPDGSDFLARYEPKPGCIFPRHPHA